MILLDSAGVERARTLSTPSGAYALTALGSPGRYRLRVLRIGYPRWDSPPLELGSEPVRYRARLPERRVLLPEITVVAEGGCRLDAEDGLAAAALWEEIRKALEATEWTIRRRLYQFRTVTYERRLEPDLFVTDQRADTSTGFRDWPIASLPAESLAAAGFVSPGRDFWSGPTYYGPDASLLVSAPFVDGHCFRARPAPPGAEPGLVGLAFDPAPGGTRPDIRGVLWVDRESAELRRLEFRYTDLPRWVRPDHAGGRLDFARLPSGAWIVRRWHLRAPIAEHVRASGETRLHGYKESGGEVTDVYTRDGRSVKRWRPS